MLRCYPRTDISRSSEHENGEQTSSPPDERKVLREHFMDFRESMLHQGKSEAPHSRRFTCRSMWHFMSLGCSFHPGSPFSEAKIYCGLIHFVARPRPMRSIKGLCSLQLANHARTILHRGGHPLLSVMTARPTSPHFRCWVFMSRKGNIKYCTGNPGYLPSVSYPRTLENMPGIFTGGSHVDKFPFGPCTLVMVYSTVEVHP